MKIYIVSNPSCGMFAGFQTASARKFFPEAEIVASTVPLYHKQSMPEVDSSGDAIVLGPSAILISMPKIESASYTLPGDSTPLVQVISKDGGDAIPLTSSEWRECGCSLAFQVGDCFAAARPEIKSNPDAAMQWMECMQRIVGDPHEEAPAISTSSGLEAAEATQRGMGLGDMVAAGLSAFGITKERVQAAANLVGIKDCGCTGRQAALNSLGRKYLGMPSGNVNSK